MHHFSVSWEITLLYVFSWNFIWFGQTEPMKMQNFKLWLPMWNFIKFVLWYVSFCWKCIKFQLKNYRGFMSHDTEKWCRIWKKTDLWFRKWHEKCSKFLPQHLKISKLELWWDPYIRSRKCTSLKLTKDLGKEWCNI